MQICKAVTGKRSHKRHINSERTAHPAWRSVSKGLEGGQQQASRGTVQHVDAGRAHPGLQVKHGQRDVLHSQQSCQLVLCQDWQLACCTALYRMLAQHMLFAAMPALRSQHDLRDTSDALARTSAVQQLS